MSRRIRKHGNGEGSVYRRSADGRWVGAVTIGFDERGNQKRKYFSAKTRAAVVTKLEEARLQLGQGLPLPTQKFSVGQWLDRWLSERRDVVSAKTFRNYSDVIRLHIKPGIGGVDLQQLQRQPEILSYFFSSLVREKGLEIGTVKGCRACLSSAFKAAMQRGHLIKNPAHLCVLPTAPRRTRSVAFDSEQALVFCDAIRGDQDEALYLLALVMGMRRGELLGLQWSDVDFERGTIQVRRQLQRTPGDSLGTPSKLELVPLKTPSSYRITEVPSVILSALTKHRQRQAEFQAIQDADWKDAGLVFPSSIGTPLEASTLLKRYYRLQKFMNLPRIRFHDLRHSAATILHAAGVSTKAIQNLLGHSSSRTTSEVYTHYGRQQGKEAARKMDEIFTPVAATVAAKKGRARNEKPQ